MADPTPDLRLPGVGDPEDSKRLWAAMQRRSKKSGRVMRLAAVLFLASATAGLVTILIEENLPVPRWMRGAITGVIAVVVVTVIERKHNVNNLRDVLREESRCLRCGYPLGEYPATCPECGTKCPGLRDG